MLDMKWHAARDIQSSEKPGFFKKKPNPLGFWGFIGLWALLGFWNFLSLRRR